MSSSNVERLVASARSVWEAAETVVSDMKDRERKQVKDLATEVARLVQKEPKEVLDLVSRFAHDCDNGYVTRGKGGGFIKGVKTIKPPKAPKAVAVDTTTDSN